MGRRGRPPKPPHEKQSYAVTVRLPPALGAKLERIAEQRFGTRLASRKKKGATQLARVYVEYILAITESPEWPPEM